MKRLVILTGFVPGVRTDIDRAGGLAPQHRRNLIFVTDYVDLDRVRGLENFRFVFHGKPLRDESRFRVEMLARRSVEVATLEEGLKWLAE